MKDTIDLLLGLLPDPLFYRLLARYYRFQEPELRRVPAIVPVRSCAFDVGAWWGPWTYWLSRTMSRVIAVEPQPRLAAFLERVRGTNVEVVNAALSDVPGSLTLTVPSARRGQDALASVEPGVVGERATVPARRLDDLATGEKVGFIKIDVEGHELAVLQGSERTIDQHKPVLFIEIEQRHLSYPIDHSFRTVTSLGYEGHFWLGRRWHPLDAFDVNVHQLAVIDDRKSRRYVNNFLFVPRRDATLIQHLRDS